MAIKKTTKPIIHIDEEAEAKINLAYAKASGATPLKDRPEFKDFGKTPSKKNPAKKKTSKK